MKDKNYKTYIGFHTHPLPPFAPETGGRAGPEAIHTSRRAVLSLTRCSTPESGPYTSCGQHSRVGPEGVGVGDPTLRTWKWENWFCSLFITARGELARQCWRAPPGSEDRGEPPLLTFWSFKEKWETQFNHDEFSKSSISSQLLGEFDGVSMWHIILSSNDFT